MQCVLRGNTGKCWRVRYSVTIQFGGTVGKILILIGASLTICTLAACGSSGPASMVPSSVSAPPASSAPSALGSARSGWGYPGRGFLQAQDLARAIRCTGDRQPPAGWEPYVHSGVMCDLTGGTLRTEFSSGAMHTAVTVTIYLSRADEEQARQAGEAAPDFQDGTVCMTLGPGWIVETLEGGGTGVCTYVKRKVGGTVDAS